MRYTFHLQGKKICKLRNESGLSQRHLRRKIKIGLSTLQDIERDNRPCGRGETRVRGYVVEELATALRVTPEQLLHPDERQRRREWCALEHPNRPAPRHGESRFESYKLREGWVHTDWTKEELIDYYWEQVQTARDCLVCNLQPCSFLVSPEMHGWLWSAWSPPKLKDTECSSDWTRWAETFIERQTKVRRDYRYNYSLILPTELYSGAFAYDPRFVEDSRDRLRKYSRNTNLALIPRSPWRDFHRTVTTALNGLSHHVYCDWNKIAIIDEKLVMVRFNTFGYAFSDSRDLARALRGTITRATKEKIGCRPEEANGRTEREFADLLNGRF